MLYAEVIVPLPLDGFFTYRIPSEFEMQLAVGMRVIVPFGRSKLYTGVVYSIKDTTELDPKSVKDLYILIDERPVVTQEQLKLWNWISEYYLCSVGDVMNAALPPAMKPQSENQVFLIDETPSDQSLLTEEEQLLLQYIAESKHKKGISIDHLRHRFPGKNFIKSLTSLLEYRFIGIEEGFKNTYQSKEQLFIRLTPEFRSQEALNELFDSLKRAPKQKELLLTFLGVDEPDLFAADAVSSIFNRIVARKKLLNISGTSAAALMALINKRVFEQISMSVDRIQVREGEGTLNTQLTAIQTSIYDSICEHLEKDHETILLHAENGSGKSELLLHLVRKVIDEGKDVLFLTPEITRIDRLSERFFDAIGSRALLYHSAISNNERVEIWGHIMNSKEGIAVLGTRTALFLPYNNLGLIIVDDEHERSYKQLDPAPRYHARDVAIMLAHLSKAMVLAVSATPSIESYYNAQIGKYHFLELKERYVTYPKAKISLIPINELRRKHIMKNDLLAPEVIKALELRLSENLPSVVFKSRRGFSTIMVCPDCGEKLYCPNCDVLLTYHKTNHKMECHYCGYVEPVPVNCRHCGSDKIEFLGAGTEKIEEFIEELFPHAEVERIDLDAIRNKSDLESLVLRFNEGAIDILVGTQMIVRGPNYQRMGVVIIQDVDSLTSFPDFRANEHAFQFLYQLASKISDGEDAATFYLQTKNPEQELLRQIIDGDYKGMVRQQLTERKIFAYPPYSRMIHIHIRGYDLSLVEKTSESISSYLASLNHYQVLGPVTPVIARIKNQYLRMVILKVKKQDTYLIRTVLFQMKKHYEKQNKQKVRIIFDVDPY